jgi:hypothetical protein
MQNTSQLKKGHQQYPDTSKEVHYVKCAICHHDFRAAARSLKVCDRCWSDFEPCGRVAPILLIK